MTKFLFTFTQIGFLLIVITLMSRIQTSQTASARSRPLADASSDDDNSEVEEERRMYDLDQLRRFLLTANAEQRAAKREKQDFYKRELIREYLQSASDPDPDRFQEIKKRFKTYCNSYEDVVNSNWATCG